MFILAKLKIEIMKKLFYSMSVVALVLASCGDASGEASGEESDNSKGAKAGLTVCDCIDGRVNMMKDILNGMSDEDAEAKYSEMEGNCKKMGEGKSDSEREALQKEAEDCPSAKEMEKLQEELISKIMSEEMMDQGLDALEDEMDME